MYNTSPVDYSYILYHINLDEGKLTHQTFQPANKLNQFGQFDQLNYNKEKNVYSLKDDNQLSSIAPRPDITSNMIIKNNLISKNNQYTVGSDSNGFYLIEIMLFKGSDLKNPIKSISKTSTYMAIPYDKKIEHVIFTPDSKKIIYSYRDNETFIYDIMKEKEKRIKKPDEIDDTFLTANNYITSLTVSPDNNLLAISYSDGQIELWDFENQKLLKRFDAHSKREGYNAISIIKFNPNNPNQLFSLNSDGTELKIWEIE
jgi:WD40 repeat protein